MKTLSDFHRFIDNVRFVGEHTEMHLAFEDHFDDLHANVPIDEDSLAQLVCAMRERNVADT